MGNCVPSHQSTLLSPCIFYQVPIFSFIISFSFSKVKVNCFHCYVGLDERKVSNPYCLRMLSYPNKFVTKLRQGKEMNMALVQLKLFSKVIIAPSMTTSFKLVKHKFYIHFNYWTSLLGATLISIRSPLEFPVWSSQWLG